MAAGGPGTGARRNDVSIGHWLADGNVIIHPLPQRCDLCRHGAASNARRDLPRPSMFSNWRSRITGLLPTR